MYFWYVFFIRNGRAAVHFFLYLFTWAVSVPIVLKPHLSTFHSIYACVELSCACLSCAHLSPNQNKYRNLMIHWPTYVNDVTWVETTASPVSLLRCMFINLTWWKATKTFHVLRCCMLLSCVEKLSGCTYLVFLCIICLIFSYI